MDNSGSDGCRRDVLPDTSWAYRKNYDGEMVMRRTTPTDRDTSVARLDPRSFTEPERAELLAEIEKGQQLAGHFPTATDMERARQILTGEVSPEDAVAALEARYPVIE